MVKIGMIIGERYEIVEKIGTGGMSDVYKAKDSKLNRYVAIKVLKQEFAENESFVSKFQIEAQAAAGLMHTNIVNVYDVGEDSGIHYIVMELVEGITLKKYIERKAGLSFKESISIAIQVCMGIDAAHKNHIIHRDIKPQNIIISKEGKVKVTDFGIAKAASSNTISSNVMGSVHYTSPEQARGGYSDAKSDIYSLGITLFEMLTGRVPFNGDTTVAIAIKHIQEPMPSPRDFVEDIPISAEGIVLKCCQKSPDRRYQNITEVMNDLKRAMATPDEDFVVNSDPSSEGGTRMVSQEELNQIRMSSNEADVSTHYGYENEDEDYEMEKEMEDNKKEKIATIFMIVFGIIIFIIIVVLVSNLVGLFDMNDIGNKIDNQQKETTGEGPTTVEQIPIDTSELSSDTVKMIEVQNMDVQSAVNQLREMGLTVSFESVNSDEFEEGKVIESNIPAGTLIKVNSNIVLTVSTGSNSIEVLNVEGTKFEDASNRLQAQGFNVKRQESNSSTVPSGNVISQSPIGGQPLKKGETVVVVVSVGLPGNQVLMPSLCGKSETDATVELSSNGLTVGDTRFITSSEYPAGQVCYQSVEVGTVMNKGEVVDLAVSLGPESDTYKCSGYFAAPTVAEAPEYVMGTDVNMTLVTDDGKVLMDVTTSSFPQTVNFFGISSSGGTLTLTYKVSQEGSTVIDPETGNVTMLPGETVTKSFTRRIDFVKEQ